MLQFALAWWQHDRVKNFYSVVGGLGQCVILFLIFFYLYYNFSITI